MYITSWVLLEGGIFLPSADIESWPGTRYGCGVLVCGMDVCGA